MRKKYITLIVIVSLTLMALSACTVNTAQTEEPSTSVSPAETEASQDPVEVSASASPSPSPSPSPASWNVVTPSSTAEVASPSAVNLSGICRGVWKDGVYKNTFSGIRFVLPEGWEVLTDEDIAEIHHISSDIFDSRDSWRIEAETAAIIYDMLAADPLMRCSVEMLFQKTPNYNNYSDVMMITWYADTVMDDFEAEDRTVSDFGWAFLADGIYGTFSVYNEINDYNQYFFFKYLRNYTTVIMVTFPDASGITIDEILERSELGIDEIGGSGLSELFDSEWPSPT